MLGGLIRLGAASITRIYMVSLLRCPMTRNLTWFKKFCIPRLGFEVIAIFSTKDLLLVLASAFLFLDYIKIIKLLHAPSQSCCCISSPMRVYSSLLRFFQSYWAALQTTMPRQLIIPTPTCRNAGSAWLQVIGGRTAPSRIVSRTKLPKTLLKVSS